MDDKTPTADVSDAQIEAAYVKAGAVIMPTPAMLAAVHGLLDAQAAAHAAEVGALRKQINTRARQEAGRGLCSTHWFGERTDEDLGVHGCWQCHEARGRDAYRARIDAVRDALTERKHPPIVHSEWDSGYWEGVADTEKIVRNALDGD